MNTKYEIDINYSSKYKNEAMMDIIRNMEILDDITEEMFRKFMLGVNMRKERVERIKSRVNRINKIMILLNSLPQSFLFKSKRYYPLIDNDNGRAFYYDHSEISNNNQYKKHKHKYLLNNNPLNSAYILGKSPDNITYDDILNTRDMINYDTLNNEIKTKLSLINKDLRNDINPILHKLTSALEYNNTSYDLRETLTITSENNNNQISNDNSLLNESINPITNGKTKYKDKPFEAPASIRQKESIMKHFNNKTILTLPKKNIELNLPMYMKLGNITDVHIDDLQNENEDFGEKIQLNTINDDIDIADDDSYNDYSQLPLDLITKEKIYQQDKKRNTLIENKKNEDIQRTINTQSQIIVANSKPIVIPGTSSNIPIPPKMPDNFFFKFPSIIEDNNVVPIKILSIQEQIGDNPITKLKKIGSIPITPRNKIYSNQNQSNPIQGNNLMDLLREQINLRYQKLHKHQNEQESSDNDNSSDSI